MNIDFKETFAAFCDMISKMGFYIYIYISTETCSNVDCRLLMTFMKHDMEKHVIFI